MRVPLIIAGESIARQDHQSGAFTADMTMALILAVPRRLTEGGRVVREGPACHSRRGANTLADKRFGERTGAAAAQFFGGQAVY